GRERGGGVVGPVGEVIAEEWCGEGCVDEACGDQIDADRRELEREVGDEGGERDGGCRGDSEASSWAACARAAHEYQGAGRPDLVDGATCDLEREQQVLGEAASRLLWRHFEGRPVMGSPGGDHHVVDRGGRSWKNDWREAGSLASKAAVRCASTSRAACSRRSGLRPVRMRLAPSTRARRAVSSPMPALPPMTTTVWPNSSGSRWVDTAVVEVVMIRPAGGGARVVRARSPASQAAARVPRAATRPLRRRAAR